MQQYFVADQGVKNLKRRHGARQGIFTGLEEFVFAPKAGQKTKTKFAGDQLMASQFVRHLAEPLARFHRNDDGRIHLARRPPGKTLKINPHSGDTGDQQDQQDQCDASRCFHSKLVPLRQSRIGMEA